MAVCGHAFWSHDVGGFTGHPTNELYMRWAQFGLFSPLVRAHGNSTRLPWEFGAQALEVFRTYARLRYRLLPYLYTYACLAAQTGLPVMRPMFLEFPCDPLSWTQDLQYMLGAELLVAPIYNEWGERSVYLPEGQWIDFWTHEVLSGPRSIQVQVPLETLPLYVRANALIPTTEPCLFTTDEPFEYITVDAYLLKQGAFELHDTDGQTRIGAEFAGDQLSVIIAGAKQCLALRVMPLAGIPQIARVVVNERVLPETEPGESLEQSNNTWTRQPDGTLHLCWQREEK